MLNFIEIHLNIQPFSDYLDNIASLVANEIKMKSKYVGCSIESVGCRMNIIIKLIEVWQKLCLFINNRKSNSNLFKLEI